MLNLVNKNFPPKSSKRGDERSRKRKEVRSRFKAWAKDDIALLLFFAMAKKFEVILGRRRLPVKALCRGSSGMSRPLARPAGLARVKGHASCRMVRMLSGLPGSAVRGSFSREPDLLRCAAAALPLRRLIVYRYHIRLGVAQKAAWQDNAAGHADAGAFCA